MIHPQVVLVTAISQGDHLSWNVQDRGFPATWGFSLKVLGSFFGDFKVYYPNQHTENERQDRQVDKMKEKEKKVGKKGM